MDALSTRRSIKAASFTESVIREMTRLANLHGAVNLAQGFPDFPAPAGGEGGGAPRDRRRRQPVRHHVGRPAFREAIAASTSGSTAWRSIPRREITVTCGIDRGDDRRDARAPRSRRRGGRLRAVLRELRARRDPVRRRAALRHAPPAGLDVRPRRAARARSTTAREPIIVELAEQPDGQGLHPRGAGADRRALRAARRHRDHRRDLRAHHSTTARVHVPIATLPGMARAHGDDQRAVQDLLRDRLARRLGDRAAAR